MLLKLLLQEGVHYVRIAEGKYKYMLLVDLYIYVRFLKGYTVNAKYFSLVDGILTAKRGYKWDGPSVPWPFIIITRILGMPQFLRASLFHDVIYQMLREGQLLGGVYDRKQHKKLRYLGDKIIYLVGRADGMKMIRIRPVYRTLRMVGGRAARPEYRKAA